MATFVKTPAGGWKAIIRDRGRILKTKTFRKKTDAREWARRIEGDREAAEALGLPGCRLTLSELAREYLDQWGGRDKSGPARTNYWPEQLGAYKLSDITSADVRRVLEHYAHGKAQRYAGIGPNGEPVLKPTDKPRSAASVNRMRAAGSALFRFAIRQGYVASNPFKGVAGKTEPRGRKRYLSDDERTLLLERCRQSRWDRLYLLVMLALGTGARMGELIRLRWSDINFEQRTAFLSKTKNDDARVLTLPEPVMVELHKHREVGSGFVFPSERFKHRPTDPYPFWYKALEEAAITDCRFHDLRHSAASYLAMDGASLLEIAEVLGHKSLQTTKRYAHLSIDHKRALTDRVLGGILK
jgi:integrase